MTETGFKYPVLTNLKRCIMKAIISKEKSREIALEMCNWLSFEKLVELKKIDPKTEYDRNNHYHPKVLSLGYTSEMLFKEMNACLSQQSKKWQKYWSNPVY
jgi:hypothetical protein